MNDLRVIVIGCGNMGSSHARSYASIDGFSLVGLVDRDTARAQKLAAETGNPAVYADVDEALQTAKPDVVCICTYPDTHHALVMKALKAGKHVFVEKPLARTVAEAEEIVRTALELKRKVVVGYILRHHPAWARFIAEARTLGKPLVMRMNLNQQSSGAEWEVHKRLMTSMSPIVDCGVHYVDIMCQMTQAEPVRVTAIGARLTDEIAKDMYNYGQLQVVFADGSVGWYEAGWGPMMSETAYFVKDVIGPRGSVSIADKHDADSSDIDAHTKTSRLLRHDAASHTNTFIDTSNDPGHQGLCDAEQRYVLKAVREDVDLRDHMNDAVNSLRIVLACDESVRTGAVVHLKTKEQR
jgi:predicted dehydrogenase